MSIARFALRMATVRALRGSTLAGVFVRDSEIGPVDETFADKQHPFILVFTDDAEGTGAGTDLFDNSGKQCLVLEMGVTTRMKAGEDWAVPTTDPGLELTLDIMERQIRHALSNPANAWAELWRDMVQDISMRRSQRGASAREGIRFAGRQLVLDLEILRDPHPGRPLSGVWSRFLTMAAADNDLAPLVPMLQATITGGVTDASEWTRLRTAYALSTARADAMLINSQISGAP